MLHTPRGSWSRTPTVADLPTELLLILSGMGGPCSESGAVLANQSPMQSLDQADRWYRARATSAYMSAARGKLAWLICLDLFIVIVLALTGYPPLRVGPLGGSGPTSDSRCTGSSSSPSSPLPVPGIPATRCC